MRNKLPNLLIIGVFKGGTTSLFHYLSKHPKILGSTKKEIHYFSSLVYSRQESLPSIEEYESYFDGSINERYRLEATPSYLYGQQRLINAMEEILEKNHKVIVVLRNPTERLISYFKFIKSRFLIDKDESLEIFIKKCLEEDNQSEVMEIGHYKNAIKEGEYSKFLEKWIKHYEEKIKIIFFDDLTAKPRETLKELAIWLGVDDNFYNDFLFEIENKTVSPRNKWLQLLALSLNKKFSKTWQRSHLLKKILRNLYYFFNSSNKRISENIENADIIKLNEVFKIKNDELRVLMEENYPSKKLPKWLKENK
jgi:hypothetical protein